MAMRRSGQPAIRPHGLDAARAPGRADRTRRDHGAAEAARPDQHRAPRQRAAHLRRLARARGERARPGHRAPAGSRAWLGPGSARSSSSSRWAATCAIRARGSPARISRCAAGPSCRATGWPSPTGHTAGSASCSSGSSSISASPAAAHRWRARPRPRRCSPSSRWAWASRRSCSGSTRRSAPPTPPSATPSGGRWCGPRRDRVAVSLLTAPAAGGRAQVRRGAPCLEWRRPSAEVEASPSSRGSARMPSCRSSASSCSCSSPRRRASC